MNEKLCKIDFDGATLALMKQAASVFPFKAAGYMSDIAKKARPVIDRVERAEADIQTLGYTDVKLSTEQQNQQAEPDKIDELVTVNI